MKMMEPLNKALNEAEDLKVNFIVGMIHGGESCSVAT